MPGVFNLQSRFKPTGDQPEAISALLGGLKRGETHLTLRGVTGSGKTEVFIRLVRHVLSLGKSAIILVPEIALTPQMVSWFRARFGDTAAVLHSRLSAGERYDEWRRIRFGEGNYITRGEAITTIAQMDPIYVRFPLSQNDVNGIFHGPKEIGHVTDVQLVTANGRNYPDKGRITIVDNQLSGSTDSYTLWAEFSNPDEQLTHHGIGALYVSLNTVREVCMIPLTAVHYDPQGAFVYIIDAENKVSRRNVIAGTVQGRLQSIYEGIQPGEVVISDGSHKTRPGATVRPIFADAGINEPGSAAGG